MIFSSKSERALVQQAEEAQGGGGSTQQGTPAGGPGAIGSMPADVDSSLWPARAPARAPAYVRVVWPGGRRMPATPSGPCNAALLGPQACAGACALPGRFLEGPAPRPVPKSQY